jgi:hypothetical protein
MLKIAVLLSLLFSLNVFADGFTVMKAEVLDSEASLAPNLKVLSIEIKSNHQFGLPYRREFKVESFIPEQGKTPGKLQFVTNSHEEAYCKHEHQSSLGTVGADYASGEFPFQLGNYELFVNHIKVGDIDKTGKFTAVPRPADFGSYDNGSDDEVKAFSRIILSKSKKYKSVNPNDGKLECTLNVLDANPVTNTYNVRVEFPEVVTVSKEDGGVEVTRKVFAVSIQSHLSPGRPSRGITCGKNGPEAPAEVLEGSDDSQWEIKVHEMNDEANFEPGKAQIVIAPKSGSSSASRWCKIDL